MTTPSVITTEVVELIILRRKIKTGARDVRLCRRTANAGVEWVKTCRISAMNRDNLRYKRNVRSKVPALKRNFLKSCIEPQRRIDAAGNRKLDQ